MREKVKKITGDENHVLLRWSGDDQNLSVFEDTKKSLKVLRFRNNHISLCNDNLIYKCIIYKLNLYLNFYANVSFPSSFFRISGHPVSTDDLSNL